MRRLLILHQGALGDFLLAFPILEGIYQCQPDLRMDFWSRREHVALIASKPWVQNVLSCEGTELLPFFHEDLWQEAPLPTFFQDAHAMLVFGQASSRALAHRLSMRIKFPVHWIQSFPDPTAHPRPVTRFLREQLAALGWPIKEISVRVEPSPEECAAARDFLASRGCAPHQKPVLLHPGSGGKKKIWPLRHWWSLLHWLRSNQDSPILLSRGPADDTLEEFAVAAQSLGVLRLEDVSLPRLSAFLCECRFYVGNDSGVSHLAAATGIPCVTLFGPTNPAVWAPQGAHVHVLQTHWNETDNPAWSPHTLPAPLQPLVEKTLRKLMVQNSARAHD